MLVDLLVDRIEFADVVVLNKVGDAGPDRLDAARKIVTSLNPDARIVETDHGRVSLDPHLGHRALRLRDRARASALGQGALRLCRPCTGDGEIRRVVLRLPLPAPFDPQSIHDVLNGPLPR